MRFFIFKSIFIFSVFLNFSFCYSWAETKTEFQWTEFSEKHIYPYWQRGTDQASQFMLAAAVASVYLVNPKDDEIRGQWMNHQKMSESYSHAGDLLGSGLGGLLVLSGQYFYDSDQDNWLSHGRALVWSSIVVTGLKYSFGRQRPGSSDSHQSFPSGHTTTAFTTATCLAYSYGWKAALLAYPVATFIGLSRLSDDAHWGSDVIAGAYLGFWAGRASAYSTGEIENVKKLNVFYPVLSPENIGIGWVERF